MASIVTTILPYMCFTRMQKYYLCILIIILSTHFVDVPPHICYIIICHIIVGRYCWSLMLFALLIRPTLNNVLSYLTGSHSLGRPMILQSGRYYKGDYLKSESSLFSTLDKAANEIGKICSQASADSVRMFYMNLAYEAYDLYNGMAMLQRANTTDNT